MSHTTRSPLNEPVTTLKGVGVKLTEQLAQLGIQRMFELLLHLPREYQDRTHVVAIDQVVQGQSSLIEGEVVYVSTKGSGMSVALRDNTGELSLRFFKVYQGLSQTMQKGVRLRVFGEVKINGYGVQIHHPEFYIVTQDLQVENTGLIPIYPSVKGLHQNKIRSCIQLALQYIQQHQTSIYTPLTSHDWYNIALAYTTAHHAINTSEQDSTDNMQQIAHMSLFEALTLLHNPPSHSDVEHQLDMLSLIKERQHPMCQRVIVEEIMAHQLSFLYRRQQLQVHNAPQCDQQSLLAEQLLAHLPFQLTNAQQSVIEEVRQDLICSSPMLRLVQGDVGSGKTLVSAVSACYMIDSGYQVALMVPTEILAEQHYQSFTQWFEPLGINVGWLVGKQKTKERRDTLQAIADNDLHIVIGTHSLFQDSVQFARLGLVIIDEQHRFGVEQRKALTNKGADNLMPHQLVMTATPIPRTLAMSAYGDMDTSTIDELPPNRTPVTTVTINRNRRDEVLQRIQANCQQGKQAYWVCPLVEESSELDAQSAEATYQDVSERLDIRIGLVHGKMKADEKQQTMHAFKQGDLDLLIATTVIEVGVDVANASLMVIENAERLGLSQLHQLRGRVGRGSQQSYCVLLYQMPLSDVGIERLNILARSHDGFVIAQKDLQLRGAGELLGKRQAGSVHYYLADMMRDEYLLTVARILAKNLINDAQRQDDVKQLLDVWLPDAERFVNV